MNTYSYVHNDPLRYIDPTGLIDLKIPGATGETSVHANPGPGVTDFRAEHTPHHVHLGSNEGPRVNTKTWEPLTESDARRMSRRQAKFCRNLSDADKALITTRQASVFRYGKILTVLLATPALGLDSLTNSCKTDPMFCIETFPEVLDSFGERCGDKCQ